MIDKKRLIKSLIIISLIIIIIFAAIQIRKTLARYETTATTNRDVEVAFWIVDNSFESKRILIEDIYPATTTFKFPFTVSNFKDSTRAETDLEYELILTTTTNLPLSYEIKKDGEPTEKVERLFEDANNTVYREIKLETAANDLIMSHEENKTHPFVLEVTFPESYASNLEYVDVLEDVKIDLIARQKID